jgi:hypothetical protein
MYRDETIDIDGANAARRHPRVRGASLLRGSKT